MAAWGMPPRRCRRKEIPPEECRRRAARQRATAKEGPAQESGARGRWRRKSQVRLTGCDAHTPCTRRGMLQPRLRAPGRRQGLSGEALTYAPLPTQPHDQPGLFPHRGPTPAPGRQPAGHQQRAKSPTHERRHINLIIRLVSNRNSPVGQAPRPTRPPRPRRSRRRNTRATHRARVPPNSLPGRRRGLARTSLRSMLLRPNLSGSREVAALSRRRRHRRSRSRLRCGRRRLRASGVRRGRGWRVDMPGLGRRHRRVAS